MSMILPVSTTFIEYPWAIIFSGRTIDRSTMNSQRRPSTFPWPCTYKLSSRTLMFPKHVYAASAYTDTKRSMVQAQNSSRSPIPALILPLNIAIATSNYLEESNAMHGAEGLTQMNESSAPDVDDAM